MMEDSYNRSERCDDELIDRVIYVDADVSSKPVDGNVNNK